MNDSTMINYIRQNVDMGITGIQKVIPHAHATNFLGALQSELSEYQLLSSEADTMLGEIGAKEVNLPMMARMGSDLMTTVKCMTYGSDSEIAEDMIKGTMTGITKLTKHLGEYGDGNGRVTSLARRVIEFEENNIQEMTKYL